MSAAATVQAIGRRFGRSAWLVIGGVAGLAVGGLAQGAVDSLNVNGVAGGWPVLLLGSAVAGIAGAVLYNGPAGLARPAVARWADVPIGIAVGLLVVGLLDMGELVRGIDEDTVGGPIGMLGRAVALGSAVVLLAGLLVRRHEGGGSSWVSGVRTTPRYHPARLGAVAIVAGWAVLVTQGQGFAIRTIDALGLVVAAVILAGLGSSPLAEVSDRPGRAVAAVLAAVTVAIGLDTVLVVTGHLDTIGIGGPATAVGYVLYLAGVVIVGLGGVHATIGLRSLVPMAMGRPARYGSAY